MKGCHWIQKDLLRYPGGLGRNKRRGRRLSDETIVSQAVGSGISNPWNLLPGNREKKSAVIRYQILKLEERLSTDLLKRKISLNVNGGRTIATGEYLMIKLKNTPQKQAHNAFFEGKNGCFPCVSAPQPFAGGLRSRRIPFFSGLKKPIWTSKIPVFLALYQTNHEVLVARARFKSFYKANLKPWI